MQLFNVLRIYFIFFNNLLRLIARFCCKYVEVVLNIDHMFSGKRITLRPNFGKFSQNIREIHQKYLQNISAENFFLNFAKNNEILRNHPTKFCNDTIPKGIPIN
jgi:hypothetical protein